LRDRRSIDPVVFGVRPDELHKGDLPAEIESRDQAVVSSGASAIAPAAAPVSMLRRSIDLLPSLTAARISPSPAPDVRPRKSRACDDRHCELHTGLTVDPPG
jgi:hypothetical protein